jgi:multidrug transporter EmrE-like cation transporter
MNIILSIPALAWLVLSALFFAFGEFLSKKFALAPSGSYIILIIFIYSLGTLCWLPAILQKNQLSIVGAIWSVLSLLATVLIGTLIFNEHLTTTGIIGVIFAFITVFLLSIA